jgi:hypothetical protein
MVSRRTPKVDSSTSSSVEKSALVSPSITGTLAAVITPEWLVLNSITPSHTDAVDQEVQKALLLRWHPRV